MPRRWRIAHPSAPERRVMDWLAQHAVGGFEREVGFGDGRTLDFAWIDHRVAIEINGHQHKPAFGEDQPRAARHAAKVRDFENAGWRVFVFDARAFSTEAQRLGAFLAAVGLLNEVTDGDCK